MPDDQPDEILRDGSHPCPHCGNFSYAEGRLATANGPIFLELKSRTWADRFKQRGKSAVIARVCTKCGHLRGFAEDLQMLLRQDPIVFK